MRRGSSLSQNFGQSIDLINYGTQIPNGIYGAVQPGIGVGQVIPGYNQNPLNGSNFKIIRLNITESTVNPVNQIPSALITHNPWNISEADTTRLFTFMSENMGPTAILGPFMINNAHFNMNIINEYVPFNNIEIWSLRNQTPIAHPFHIHNVQFYVLDINGQPPPPQLAGRKDVILVPGGNSVVRFITKFETFYDDVYPYMYHCHMLTHEDHGMMGQFIVMNPDEPIPVELASFNAIVEGTSVKLYWSTITERNNSGFEIERKQVSEWISIGFIEGKGTTTELQSYSFFNDNLSSGNYQYRLKQIDFDGSFEYSSSIAVNVEFPSEFELTQNYPNPFNPNTVITYSLPVSSYVTLKIYNLLGSEISTLINNEIRAAGIHHYQFSALNLELTSGIYFYTLKTPYFTQTKKMVLLH